MPYTYYISALILTVGGAVFWACPPRQINEFYGYRTTRSRKSQEAWDFAQKTQVKMYIKPYTIYTNHSEE